MKKIKDKIVQRVIEKLLYQMVLHLWAFGHGIYGSREPAVDGKFEDKYEASYMDGRELVHRASKGRFGK